MPFFSESCTCPLHRYGWRPSGVPNLRLLNTQRRGMPICACNCDGGKLVLLHDTEADACVFRFPLQIFGKLFSSSVATTYQGEMDLPKPYPLAILS